MDLKAFCMKQVGARSNISIKQVTNGDFMWKMVDRNQV